MSIEKMAKHFLLNVSKQRHGSNYKGKVPLRLHKCQNSSRAMPCQPTNKSKASTHNTQQVRFRITPESICLSLISLCRALFHFSDVLILGKSFKLRSCEVNLFLHLRLIALHLILRVIGQEGELFIVHSRMPLLQLVISQTTYDSMHDQVQPTCICMVYISLISRPLSEKS